MSTLSWSFILEALAKKKFLASRHCLFGYFTEIYSKQKAKTMNNTKTFNPGTTLALELVAFIKGIAHALVIPSIIIVFAVSYEIDNIKAISLGLVYIMFATFMYEYYAEQDGGRWLRSQKYYYAIIFPILFTATLISITKGF